MSTAPQVAVIGGGYAGFAAAVTLARGGARVDFSAPGPGGPLEFEFEAR